MSASSVLGFKSTVFRSKSLVFSKMNDLSAAQDRANAALVGDVALLVRNITSAREMG